MEDRLKDALALREELQAKAQRIAGLKEAAEKNLEEVEKEIRANNLDPEDLDSTLEKLKAAFEIQLAKFESDLQSAKESLSKFEGN